MFVGPVVLFYQFGSRPASLMHISRLEIENIKSYRKASFEMTRGTTAITGRNGAGKTTIIEAIAWVLFDHLEYKKDDFVRRGEKKGWARVTFESGLDEREYVVYRDTGTGYYVLDPRIDTGSLRRKRKSSDSFGPISGSNPEPISRRCFARLSECRRAHSPLFF